jgi:hypothetical protein
LLPSLAFYDLYSKNPHKIRQFLHPNSNPIHNSTRQGVVTEFLINKCGLTDEEITKAFRHAILASCKIKPEFGRSFGVVKWLWFDHPCPDSKGGPLQP